MCVCVGIRWVGGFFLNYLSGQKLFYLSLHQVEVKAETMAGQKFHEFEAIAYREQVVAGVNYFIKVSQECYK